MNLIEDIIREYSERNSYGRKDFSSFLKISVKWEEIVGSSLYKISKPEFYKAGVLTVALADSVWANEFMLYKSSILSKIKNMAFVETKDIKTRIDGCFGRDTDNKDSVQKKPHVYALSKEDEKFVEEIINASHIENEELRKVFKQTISKFIENATEKNK